MKLDSRDTLGVLPDERTVRIQDIAGRRSYYVLAVAMLLYGLFDLITRGELLALINMTAVAVSFGYIVWQRKRFASNGVLDERSETFYNHQFRFLNVGLFLACILFTAFAGGLWLFLIILPSLVTVVTLLSRRAYPGRVWAVWLAMGLAFGFIAYFGVREMIPQTLGWVLAVLVGVASIWYTVKAYRRPGGL